MASREKVAPQPEQINKSSPPSSLIRCNYLVIGAGTAGMSFVDTILTEHKNKSSTIVLVDRFSQPGGHWTKAYPFVELHQTSCNYGVNSVPLGKNINKKGNERYDFNDRATGKDVVEYYGNCCKKFKETGRVQCFFNTEYKFDEKSKKHTIIVTDDYNDKTNTIIIECDKLVTVKTDVTVPSMRQPLIPVDESVRSNFVPVNDVPAYVKSGKYSKYIIFGNGKTGVDTIVNLMKNNNGVDQSQITWICSRDVWYFLRESLEDFYGTFQVFSTMASAKSVKECYLSFEQSGLIGRLDDSPPNGTIPDVFKGPIIGKKELDMIRTVQNVVRMGRATSILSNRISLDDGNLDFSPDDTLLVDCMVDNHYGYCFPEDIKIFEPGKINLGPLLAAFNVSLSAAHTAFLECSFDDDQSKNDRCYFLRGKHAGDHVECFIGAIYMQNKSIEALMKIKGGPKFLLNSRTNMNSPKHHKGGLLKMMWNFYGPKKMYKFDKELKKKVESKGYSDVDHCFGIETFCS